MPPIHHIGARVTMELFEMKKNKKSPEPVLVTPEIYPPARRSTTEDENQMVREGIIWLIRAAITSDPALTMHRIKSILGAADKHIQIRFGGQTTHRVTIDGDRAP
jgi:hypothetical protein